MCKIVVKNGEYILIDGEKETILKIDDFGSGPEFRLPDNTSNRKYARKSKVDKAIEENGQFDMAYKETRTLGPKNEQKKPKVEIDLSKYLTEEEAAEYKRLQTKIEKAKKIETQKALIEMMKKELEEMTAEESREVNE